MPRHTCHNHAPRTTLLQPAAEPDGWTGEGRRALRQNTPNWMPVECGHHGAVSDPACTGCRWRGWRRHDD